MNIGPNQRKDRGGTGFSENILCVSIMVIRAQHHQPKIFGTAEYLSLITFLLHIKSSMSSLGLPQSEGDIDLDPAQSEMSPLSLLLHQDDTTQI